MENGGGRFSQRDDEDEQLALFGQGSSVGKVPSSRTMSKILDSLPTNCSENSSVDHGFIGKEIIAKVCKTKSVI